MEVIIKQSNQCKKCEKALQEEDYVFMGYCENCYNQIHNISTTNNQENTKSNTLKENKVKHNGYIKIANVWCTLMLILGTIGAMILDDFPFILSLSCIITIWILVQGIVCIVENTEK